MGKSLEYSTIEELSKLLSSLEISTKELALHLLDRSEKLDPDLNVWVTMNPNLEIETYSQGNTSQLAGIPMGIKDIYCTRDMKTTCCSPIYEKYEPGYDAQTVKMLRDAKAVIMGKTVTTQFACGDPPPTKNPWNLSRTPGGSSSGSAVGVASGMFPAALGSQTAGSVLRPASYNGIVGFKPTYGLVSRQGVFPVALSLDTMGWFTRSVKDAAILLRYLSGYDAEDKDSVKVDTKSYISNTEPISRPPHIGIVEDFYYENSDRSTMKTFALLLAKLSKAGAIIETANTQLDFDSILKSHRVIMNCEAANTHKDNYEIRPDDFAPRVKEIIENGLNTPAHTYIQSKHFQQNYTRQVSKLSKKYDALIMPTSLSAAPTTETTGEPIFQAPWTMAGVPAISLPYELDDDGMPLGVQIISNHFNELNLLSTSMWIESVVNFTHKPPLI
jgi:aspartyl-tRNA(Asn)/glutamyl-tRNA(Gln) amidotransferase subunit A|tara:strand:+ start:1255 stop:2586 length:1332 start_codon:yes stop_codon:yes gene_type:complete